LEKIDIAKKITDAALEKQASDIVILDMQGICSFADYFVICSGESDRQLEAIADEIDDALAKDHITPRRHQGSADSGWIIIDLVDIIVHIFSTEQREFYTLEEMWQQASVVLKIL